MPNAIIYVAMHKRDDHVLAIKDSIYVPIHCGKSIYVESKNTTGYLPEFGDNTGDNISDRNLDYCELTAMYWAWKNDKSKPDDIIGLNHYRRYFCESTEQKLTLMSQKTMEHILFEEGYHFIVSGCGIDGPESEREGCGSVYQSFAEMHDIRNLDNAITAIHMLHPSIADKVEYILKHNFPMCYCNMLITTKKYFDEYAAFLFPVLNYVAQHQEPGTKGPGYTAERLLRPWLLATGHSAKQGHELDWTGYSGYEWKCCITEDD